MALYAPDMDQFRQQIRELLAGGRLNSRTLRRSRHAHIYTCGDRDLSVYFVESGRIKMMSPSPEGKECLVAIYTAGDIFGELSLCGQMIRPETAVAMCDSVLKQIAPADFLSVLRRDPDNLGFLKYMVARLGEQRQVISSLLMVNSEQRLAHTLLRLAREFGKRNSPSVQIEQKMSQEELAAMVGTTRTRIGIFLKRFRRLGLIELSAERHIIIRLSRLADYADGLPPEDAGTEYDRQMRFLLKSTDKATPADLTVSLRKTG